MHKLSYQPGRTVFHRLYPLTKFVWLLLGSGLVFLITNSYLLLLTSAISFGILYRINPRIWHIRGFRLVLITGFMLFILYLFFDKQGVLLIDPGIHLLTVTSTGVQMGLLVSSRFLCIIFISYIFILTTRPSDLAYALMKVGLPYRYGFMLVTALRLAPILEDEGITIYRAQLVRGIQYDRSHIKKILLFVEQFMTPLLISALRRADKLVFSMEGRGFGQFKNRTFHHRAEATALDLYINITLIVYFTSILILNYGGNF